MRRLTVLIAAILLSSAATIGSGSRAYVASADSGSAAVSTHASAPTAADIVATAEQYLGYPYAYIGDDPSTGFSCIGFIHFIFGQHGMNVPEELSAAYGSAPAVDQKQLLAGDLVFFQDTLWSGISHVDLYIGNGKMIGADSFQTGVQIDTLSDPYWQAHYLGSTRPLYDSPGTPPEASPTASPSPAPATATVTPTAVSVTIGSLLRPLHGATVYSGPGDRYQTVGTVTPSTWLTTVRVQGQWVNVAFYGGSEYGWLDSTDLDLSSAHFAPAAPTPTSGTSSARSASGQTSGESIAIVQRDDSGKTLAAVTAVPVYSGPDTADRVFAMLAAGNRVRAIRSQGPWDQVVLPDGAQGWVRYQALTNVPPGGAGPRARVQVVAEHPAASGRRVVVVADVLFVRAGPFGQAGILRRVHAGDRLRVLATRIGWDYVALRDDSRGWVNAEWVRESTSG